MEERYRFRASQSSIQSCPGSAQDPERPQAWRASVQSQAAATHNKGPGQIEHIVAVVENRQSSGVAVESLQLGQALDDGAHGNFPGPDDRDNLVKIRDADVGGEAVQNEPDRDAQPMAGLLSAMPHRVCSAWV